VLWSKSVMSDVPATAAVAWLAVWTVSVLQRRARLLESFALGVACGLAVWIRQPLVVVAAAVCVATLLLAPEDFAARLGRAFVTGLGVIAGVTPFLWLNARLFGSPLRSGYGFWTQLSTFSLGHATRSFYAGQMTPLGVLTEQFSGDASLYAWPATLLLLLGTAIAFRLGRGARTLCVFAWIVSALFASLLVSYSMPTRRLLLPILPLLAATMSLAVADAAPRASRALGAVLLAGALWLNRTIPMELLGQPTVPIFDTATLQKTAAVVETNAVVIAYTSPLLFARVLRGDGDDRVWIPLRADDHMLTIAARGLKPLEHDSARGGWIEKPIQANFSPGRVIARIEALCHSGRPIYLSGQRATRVSFMPDLERALREHFGLVQVVPPDPWPVYRIECGTAPGDTGQVS